MDLDLVQAQVKYVTPEMAAQWLRSNTANRKPSKAAIKRWAQIMRAHAWKLCSDAIAFDVDGVLINGQHRLMAVIETGMTQPFLVANNFPTGSKEACDIGKKRQLHEILTIGGYEINQMHAAVCRFLLTPWEQAGAIEVDHEIHRNRIKRLHRELKAKINFIEGCIKGKELRLLRLLQSRLYRHLSKMTTPLLISLTCCSTESVATTHASQAMLRLCATESSD